MKKLYKLMLAISCIFYFNDSNAQVDTSTTEKLINYILQSVDKSQVPTGFLTETGAHILPMPTFNGTLSDSNVIDMNLWRTMYYQLQTSYVGSGTNPLPSIVTVNSSIKANSSVSLPIPIPILIGTYNTVATNAFSSNLLSYNSSQKRVYDVAGRSQSPYASNTVFVACATKYESITGADNYIIPASLVYNTSGKTISQISINFANGQGFTNVSIGTTFTANYTDTGYKRWTIKVAFTDNTTMQCYQDYYVHKIASSSSTTTFSYPNFYPPSRTIQVGFAPTLTDSGALVTVAYTARNTTNTLRKPLIVVEGYDVFSVAPSLVNNQNYSYVDFINGINEPRLSYNFNDQLDSIAGYDIVFIDFTSGTDSIQRNARLVQRVIQWVDSLKALNGSTEQNVIMGLSMGGLVARYALADMTKRSVPTQTRLLITHDSPHRGANVPLGLQYFIKMLGSVQLFSTNIRQVYPDYDDLDKLLAAPATQQLLLYRATTTNTYANNTFLDGDYRNMITFASTDPQPSYRFIATSLGSECAKPLYSPYKTFINFGAGTGINISAKFIIFKIPIASYDLGFQAEAYSLPAAGTSAKLARVYAINKLTLFGFIDIFKELYENEAYTAGELLPVDGVPGATYPFIDTTQFDFIKDLPRFNPLLTFNLNFRLFKVINVSLYAYYYNSGLKTDFTFVPVGSALDVSPFTTPVFSQKYVNGTNQNYPSSTDNFIAQESVNSSSTSTNATNNAHIRFTARNSRWLFNEMENLPNTVNCSDSCSNPYYIQGIDAFCTSGSYYIPGLPRGATVTWQATPSGIVTPAQNGNQVTLTKLSDGIVTLTATITNGCGSSVVAPKDIAVGVPDRPKLLDEFGNEVTFVSTCTDVYKSLCPIVDAKFGVLEWEWEKVTGDFNLLNFNSCADILGFSPSYGFVSVRVRNACGWSSPTLIVVNVTDCSGGGGFGRFSASPNPTTGDVQIEATSTDKTTTIKEIQVTDKFGNIKKTIKLNTSPKKHKINIADLPADIYIIRIYDGKTWVSKKVIKS